MIEPAVAPVRSGTDLMRATMAYAKEDRAKTWRLLITSLAVYGIGVATAIGAPWFVLQLAGSVLAGLTTVRLFIFFHDYLHGALFKKSPMGKAVMTWVGVHTLNPPSVWKETHDYHHANNAKMTGASIGSFPIVTTRMWNLMNPSQKRMYRLARNPVFILFGYLTIFVAGMCLAAFVRAPKRHWQSIAALTYHVGLIVLIGVVFNPLAAFMAVILPAFITSAMGSYLFYVQHNFPDIQLRDRRKWDFHFAALNSSSMFEMPSIMHWFTGNIGYHHVHHLNHKIPFYRLPEAMANIPELQSPGRVTWSLQSIRDCFSLKLWDPRKKKMVGWV